MMLLGLSDHLVAEHDPYFAVGALPADRLEPGFLGGFGVAPLNVPFQAGHKEEHTDDAERPHDQDRKQEQLVRSHRP
ncbi:MAG: hypothetical protein QOH48_2322 [Actinomycetota bacterium]|nr:hypothetical protein [Actinomycetota bacterium]